MNIKIPELCVVALIGTSGSGKSTFAKKHFKSTEILSSDYCRGLVSDDENNLEVTSEAFELLYFIARQRLTKAKLVVIDATNVQEEARKSIVRLAKDFHCFPVAIVLDISEKICLERNRNRPERSFGSHVVKNQHNQLQRSLRNLKREGFRQIYTLSSLEEVDSVVIERQRLWTDLKNEHGPFDIIGDIHGCFDELEELLKKLGYEVTKENNQFNITHPEQRKIVFLGDLVDRGPKVPDVLRLVMTTVEKGMAICVPGNHDIKLVRFLKGENPKIAHGLQESIDQLGNESPEFKEKVKIFLDGLISHYVLDDGKLVVAHAGMKLEMQGRASGQVREFALFGETTGETDEFGLPVRYNWASEYRGKSKVVYGHTPVPKPEWFNNTINIDTGCVFGGQLTALRYPKNELVSVQSHKTYAEPIRPLKVLDTQTAQQQHDDFLDISDILGKKIIATRTRGNITIQEDEAMAALEVMSRFAVNPKWLIYLPPTMSPVETSKEEGMLEHPQQAFAYYRKQGTTKVICEEKHMGSRAVIVLCQDEEAALKRFGIANEGIGVCYTRTGRRFFNDLSLEKAFLEQIKKTLDRADFWKEFNTTWVCLDCELMPWSMKAQELLREQYAAVGSAAQVSLKEAAAILENTLNRYPDAKETLSHIEQRKKCIAQYVDSYRHYCWPVHTLSDIKLAPFHLLATEGVLHVDKDHLWHMNTLAKLAGLSEGLIIPTNHKIVDLSNEQEEKEAIEWWKQLTANGGEGMVVKPLIFFGGGKTGVIQPAVKCRGREYLRIIYGAEYTLPQHLIRLRERAISAKRSLAIREFVLGIEALERFVNQEPLRNIHECVFGVLALESEAVDPRL